MNVKKASFDRMIERLISIVDAEHVLCDPDSCSFYSQDIFTKSHSASAVVRPCNIEALSAVVKTVVDAGYQAIPRGAGTSYSDSFVPQSAGAVIIDMQRMNRVLEINTDDMYVTVECGCTWSDLYAALKESGYRTAYWGTLSGSRATIGGGLSQNSIFWGSGIHGTAADNVIGLQVVLADGSIIKTGSGAQTNSTPFFRHFGPDLTGLFTGDSGAFGFKAVASFRLIKQYEGRQYCAFDFKSAGGALATMSEVSRRGLATECFGFDPFLQSQRLKRESVGQDAKSLSAVMNSAGSLIQSLKDGAQLAIAGRQYMDDVDYSVQMIVEDYHQKGANVKANEIISIAGSFGGKEIANSIPKVMRANPFGPLNSVLGPTGERWAPVHALVSHSKAQAMYQSILDLLSIHKTKLEEARIEIGFLFNTVASNCFVIEPVFFWPDASTEIHKDMIEPNHFARLTQYPEDLETRELVSNVRKKLANLFHDSGAVHFQIGKMYQYADAIPSESLELIMAIKRAVDPLNLINPAALGLPSNSSQKDQAADKYD